MSLKVSVLFMLLGAVITSIMGNVIGVSTDFLYIGTLIGAFIGFYISSSIIFVYEEE